MTPSTSSGRFAAVIAPRAPGAVMATSGMLERLLLGGRTGKPSKSDSRPVTGSISTTETSANPLRKCAATRRPQAP